MRLHSILVVAPLVLVLVACGDDTGGAGGGGTGGGGTGGGGGGDAATTDAASTDASTGSGTDGCAGLCTGAGFDGGTETDFGGGLIECVCEGSGEGVAQEDCATYCATFDVPADKAYLSEAASPNDKCVCDGTT